ncbi:MAG: hypothetical protein SW833_18285 [Cyanobacteriota bacterium]|nr:hypothetical protein [Cyanobacteriota bacterium]
MPCAYEKLTSDGLTQWHPAFLQLGATLEDCARKYRGFCNRYKTKSKTAKKCHWGNRLLAGMKVERRGRGKRGGGIAPSSPPCQVTESPEVSTVARQFIGREPSALADPTADLKIDLGCGKINRDYSSSPPS